MNDPLGTGEDLAVGGTGGNGGDVVDLAGGTMTVVDLAQAPAVQDMAQPAPVPDLAQPPVGPDMAQPACAPPSGSACVVYPQCGCTSTQSCDITDTTGHGVCVAPGSTPDWNGCTGSGQCKKGSTCVHGVCTPFCATVGAPSADCAGGSAECYQLQDASQSPAVDIPNDKVCTNNCDPVNPQNATGFSPCGPGINCFPDTDHYAWCLGPTTSSGTQGVGCGDTFELNPVPTKCAPGYYCYATSSTANFYCYKMCHVGGAAGDCPSGKSCKSYSTKMYAGAAEIGYCN